MLKRSATRKILLALSLALTLGCALPGNAQTNRFYPPLSAGQLTGMKVESIDGEKVGNIHNLVLDMRSGDLKYVVIGSGGLLGVNPTLRLAPSRIMSAATTKRATLAIFTTTGVWNAAPVFKPSNLASLEDPERSREISRHFQPPGARVTNSGLPLSKTGIDGKHTNTPRPELKFASDLMGRRVVNQKQEKLGQVVDLLVGFGPPHPAFAIVGSGKLFRRGPEYAVPLTALKSMERGNKLLLEIDDTRWQQAPMFSEQAWNSPVTDWSVYRYLKSKDGD